MAKKKSSGRTVQVKIEFDLRAAGVIDQTLAELPIKLRKKGLRSALTKVGKVIQKRARQLAPRSKGYTKRYRKKAGKKRLFSTIGTVVRTYDKAMVMVVGPQYPAGAHGHLLEFGHRIVARGRGKKWADVEFEGRFKKLVRKVKTFFKGRKTSGMAREFPFMRPAAEDTKGQAQGILEQKLREWVDDQKAKGNV